MAFQSTLLPVLIAFVAIARATIPHAICFDLIMPIEVDVIVTSFNVVPFVNTFESKDLVIKTVERNANASTLIGDLVRLHKT